MNRYIFGAFLMCAIFFNKTPCYSDFYYVVHETMVGKTIISLSEIDINVLDIKYINDIAPNRVLLRLRGKNDDPNW